MFAQHLSLLSCLFTFVGVFDFGNAAALLRFTSREAAGSIRGEKKQALFPNQLLVRLRELERQGADLQFHPHPVLRALPLPVHADGTVFPDFI